MSPKESGGREFTICEKLFYVLTNIIFPGSVLVVFWVKDLLLVAPSICVYLFWILTIHYRIVFVPSYFIILLVAHISICTFVTINCIRLLHQSRHRFRKSSFALILVTAFIMVLSNIGPKKLIAYEVYFVPTDSMVPAIFPGEVTLVDTSKNAIEDIGVGDIVAFSAIPEGLLSAHP